MSIVTVKLSRGDHTPWGFRLQGGKDFGSPIAVQRVNPNSLAEQGGLQPGDMILTINNNNADLLRHKEAQDCIVRAGNILELKIERGGTRIWKPTVAPVGNMGPTPGTLTKTSLAANKQGYQPVGSSHNVQPKPFSTLPSVVNRQYNSPVNIYSMQNIAEALTAQTEVLASGAKGINFMKEDKPINKGSAVYQMVHQTDDDVHKGDDEDPLAGLGVNTQSNAFRRLAQGLDPEPVPPPGMGIKHVTAPTPKAPAPKPAEPNQSLCADCGRLIVGVFVRIKDKSLHAECFKCSTCGTSLKNVGYYNVHDKLYCDIHAKQAATMMGAPAHVEPITIAPGGSLPYNTPIVSVGAPPPSMAPAPVPMASPRSPGTAPPFTNISPMPFHSAGPAESLLQPLTTNGFHEQSEAPKAPVAPPSSHLPGSFGHPKTAPSADAHRQVAGGAKFIWPPPKGATSPQLTTPTFESNASPSLPTYRPAPGTQHINHSPSVPTTPTPKPTTPTSTKVAPTLAPKPRPPAQSSVGGVATPTKPQPTWSTPAPANAAPGGISPMSGSRPAPRRGRGQLKPQATPGTRIPICSDCGSPIRGPFIVALGKTWCPDHFLCKNNQCRRPLQDIGFVEEQGQLYCENCWEAYLAPTCCKCNARIKGDCLNALDRQWHPECFVCAYCRKPFGNSSFYLEDGQPYCEKDWNEMFTTKCVGCGFPIEAGDRWVEALSNNYHSQCFKCTICHKNLEGQSFYAKGGRPFCKAHAR